ncbi:sensor histidine kinase [Azospirillum soli]|uniref:sensor histidine kinase n=1 Tax=Azospirillum soli TaxID=1304799 RepID=UPI001AE4027D|nr:extracellular solute-binding protein [Azospirillum soli]
MWRNFGRRGKSYSLRRRLLIGLFAALAVLAAVLYLFVESYARRAADSAFDRLLLASALSIADTVRVQDGRFQVDLPYSAFDILAMARRDRIFYRISAPDGTLITGYDDLPVGKPRGDAAAPRFADASYRGMALRVAVLTRFVAQPGLSGRVTIAVAQTREERNALAGDILVNAFLPIALAVLAGAGLIWFGVRRALAPLGSLERIIRDRNAHDLSPIAMPPPEEVSQLVQAINQLMGRLKTNLDTMQMFLADAAHQIRTPLASLRLQAELAADEEDPQALRRIALRVHRNAVEASQLTSQLLNHAMVMHRSEVLDREPVDLGALMMQVAQRAQAVAGTAIRLEVDGAVVSPTIQGDPITLREALTNLVDNAVKYAGPSGPIDVRLTAGPDGEGLRVEIADHGPGIPDGEKAAVLERFGRGSSSTGVSGSGLGLAIVRSVAEAHGAALSLLDRPGGGLIVRLDFPVTEPAAPASARPGAAYPGAAVSVAFALLALFWGTTAQAGSTTLYPAPGGERLRLSILGATDLPAMEPLILDFQQTRPEVAIHYTDLNSSELYTAIAEGQRTDADLLISSAVDLQVKLVNDGHTRPHRSEVTVMLPDWANWRDEAFGFTFEPAVIVYNRALVPETEVPHSRDALIRLLREKGADYRRRVATYDASFSGIGYLFATQDSVLFSQFWQLVAMLGQVDARLACCTGDILDLVERGEVLIAYNMLGSYAKARAASGAPIGIVLPEDYTQVISRVAVIPRAAPRPDLAGDFIDYLLSPRGQGVVGGRSGLYALSAELRSKSGGPLQPIALSPALLAFLDKSKRERFLQQWEAAIHLP